MTISEATLQDRPHFMRLYSEFQKDQREKGSYFLPSTHNLNLAKNMFEKYAEGQVEGFTLLWTPEEGEPVAILMAGSDINPNHWELSLEKLAILWSVYVQPSHRGQGLTMKLFKRAWEMGVGMGYQTIVTYALVGNTHGERVAYAAGVKPAMVEYNLNLLAGMKTSAAQEGLERKAV